ncbi:drug resistance transporter, Bcr/CflA subfamily [Serratia marcescens]|nr:drug resistance transporter, Bcr/CflA subfamily [Serratia marcescens]
MTKAACVKRSGLWSIPARTMALACLLVFMAQMATTVYLPSLPTVMRELAMSRRATELSISIFVIGAALPVLFWGVAAAGAVLLEHHGLWALAIALLGLGGWLMVKLRM